jgi:hypothetical protein
MRLLLSLTAGLLAAMPLLAAESGKANALTEKEIADGWILLFDGETTFGWSSPNVSGWTVSEGMIAPQAGKPGLLVTTTAFADYELSLDYRLKPDSKVQVHVRCDPQGKPAAPSDTIELQYQGNVWSRMTVQVVKDQTPSPNFQTLGAGFFGASASRTFSTTNARPEPRRGHIAVAGNGVVFRNVKLKPINQKPLLNGTDLSGWKVFPGEKYKSKFAMTPEGFLNIKNGPGDLQTEGQWADFVLQLECISNGPHLNSGVFFRCIPDQYQNGYEAQIRNQFTTEPTQEYVVEEYDPQTNQLKDKKKVTSTAVDFGTGAIYRRQPARRGASKDGEWFTMTVVAHGRHIATWVNGVQVTDWTDNRALNANPRNGCRLEKGPISLQGHDPTTDLSFRNFRIAELPPLEKK